MSGLHDTAWLALRCERTPGRVTGGTLHRINGTQYWLEATEDTVRIEWEGTP